MNRYDLMRHALGVHEYRTVKSKGGSRWKKPYRNHFCPGVGHVDVWESLVADGLAQRTSNGDQVTGGAPVYVVTDAGRDVALAGITFKRQWGYGTPTNGGAP